MAGTTIDQLDLSVYNMYAVRTMMNEQIQAQMRLSEAASIPPQIQIVDIFPRQNEIDLLLGIIPLNAPWAYFYPPKKLRFLRRGPFAFHRVAPSFGSVTRHDEELALISSTECESAEEKQEQAALMGMLKQMGNINSWMGYIVGRIGQFLQG